MFYRYFFNLWLSHFVIYLIRWWNQKTAKIKAESDDEYNGSESEDVRIQDSGDEADSHATKSKKPSMKDELNAFSALMQQSNHSSTTSTRGAKRGASTTARRGINIIQVKFVFDFSQSLLLFRPIVIYNNEFCYRFSCSFSTFLHVIIVILVITFIVFYCFYCYVYNFLLWSVFSFKL